MEPRDLGSRSHQAFPLYRAVKALESCARQDVALAARNELLSQVRDVVF